MKAKKIQNFINEQDIEEILLSEPPSRLESFEGDMNEWLKNSNYEAKDSAVDTFSFFTDVRDYVQAEFADNLGYDSLENFRNDTIDLWRAGPVEGLSSFFLNREAAESYSKRMGIFEPEHYKAKGKDIIPTGAGSGEVIVSEEDIIRKGINEKLFKGPDIDEIDDPQLKPLFRAIEDLKRHNIKILNININPYNKDYVSLHIKGMRDYLISFDKIKNTWRIMKSSEFTIFNKSWEETFETIKKILRNNNELTLKESKFKPKSKKEVERDNPELAPLYDAVKDLQSLDLYFKVTSMAGLPPEIKIIRIDGLPLRRIIYFPYAYKQFPKGWVITKHEDPDKSFFSSENWKEVFDIIKERIFGDSSLSESIFKPKSKEEVERDNPGLAPIYDAIKDLQGTDLYFKISSMDKWAGFPYEIKSIRLEGMPHKELVYSPYEYKHFPKGWSIFEDEKPNKPLVSFENWEEMFEYIRKRIFMGSI